MVSKISIVGVDDSVSPQDIIDISHTFKFVEWGINICSCQQQKIEYPSSEWIDELLSSSKGLRLRGILHGRWASDMIAGTSWLQEERPDLWEAFRWLQVDVSKGIFNIQKSIKDYPGKLILKTNHVPLFPAQILLPRNMIFSCLDFCGYSVLETDLDLICRETWKSFWVSIEGFRTKDNITMDMGKVVQLLDQAADCVTHDSFVKSLP